MADIRYSVCALPWSVAADDDHHVSLFVSPRLSPDGKLGEFDPVSRWTDVVTDPGTVLTLTDQTGQPYEIQPILPDDPTVWSAVFPAETPVRAWDSRSLDGRALQSFPAKHGVDVAKVLHTASFAAGPIEPPAPSASFLAPLMESLARHMSAWRETHDGMVYDESLATHYLDRATDGGRRSIPAERSSNQPLAGLMLPVIGDLHRARRFFERPESAQPYLADPDPEAVSPRLENPERDFHERLTLLGDQPALLRRLGLVIDLVVADLGRLSQAQWLTGRIELAGAGDLTLPTRVRCRAAGKTLVTIGLDGGDWHDGRLRLGDSERFSMLDLDPDASALKLDRFLWTVPRLSSQESSGEPAHAAPPTLKGHGFGVARADRADDLGKRQAAAATKTEPALTGGDAPLLHTEDVNRGMRVEVWDDTARRWFTLHARGAEVAVDGMAPFHVDEEGWIQGGTVQETYGIEGGTVYVHESVFGWSGWSLSAPHPALSLEHTYGTPPPAPDDPERNERLTDPELPAAPAVHVVTQYRVTPGTLPRLRYGRSYALRAWSVDLAGASPKHELT
ncbi:MAG: hypothetical protein H0T61_13600, partial [Actinobacteria bacterium]|nr:hypothetical protein [Actinomycetota bacterium]